MQNRCCPFLVSHFDTSEVTRLRHRKQPADFRELSLPCARKRGKAQSADCRDKRDCRGKAAREEKKSKG